MFLGGYDADKKRKPARKLEMAFDAYCRKFGEEPNVALVNETAAQELESTETLTVRGVHYIPANTFNVGFDDPMEQGL
jgi:hypothetical protein